MTTQKASEPGGALHKPKKATLALPLVLIGVGLVFIGIVAALLLPKPGASSPQKIEPVNQPSVVPAAVNAPAPELSLSDLQGNPVSLADFRGRWVLVNNWATWCPPCKAEMPVLQTFYNDHRDQNFDLIAIETGEPVEEVAEFVEKYKLGFTVWPDPGEKVYEAFRNISLPTSWVIDPGGQIRLTWTGAINREMLEKYVTPLLEE